MKTFWMYFKHWVRQFVIAIDQLFNCLLPIRDSWADETFSARCWRKSQAEGARAAWRISRLAVDALFFVFERNHCQVCYEFEQHRLHSPPEERYFVDDVVIMHTKK